MPSFYLLFRSGLLRRLPFALYSSSVHVTPRPFDKTLTPLLPPISRIYIRLLRIPILILLSKNLPRADEAYVVAIMDQNRNPDIPHHIIEDGPDLSDKESYTSEHRDRDCDWASPSRPPTPGKKMRLPAPQESDSSSKFEALQQLATDALANFASPSQASDLSPGPQHAPHGDPRRQAPALLTGRDLPFRREGSLPVSASAPTPSSSSSYAPPDYFQTNTLLSALNPTSPVGTGLPAAPLASPKSIGPRSPTASLLPHRPSQQHLPRLNSAPLNSAPNPTGRLPSLHQLMGPHSPTSSIERDDDHLSYPQTSPFAYQPSALPRPPSISGHHQGTPPVSPNGSYGRDFPSSPKPQGRPANYYPTSKPGPIMASGVSAITTSSLLRSAGGEYMANSNAATSNTDHSGLSAVEGLVSSGNGSGSSEVGTFKCTFEGCQAKPFQTQYLLNSHANVHSSARPHYCPVQGCPRSKPGQGFKRKNEMIRHGFVHESPGYACPFCPDREHKYPRPDNLQRYVHV